MKVASWFPLVLSVLVLFCSAGARAETVRSDNGWTLQVDPTSGQYDITTATPAWTVGGALTNIADVVADHGTDRLGSYHAIRFHWRDGGQRSGSIRIYQQRPLALFTVKFEDAVQGSPAAFPLLTRLPANLMAFRYGEQIHLRPEVFHLQSNQPDEQYGGPFCLFDDHANAMILSPASDFMVAMMSGDLQHGLASGLNRSLAGVPAGYQQQTLLAMGPGINRTWDAWGHGLTDLYAKPRPANDADTGLKYLSYWTDNGSYYYYNYDLDKGYAGTLLAVKDHLLQRGIPIHSMQLDSWWYPKTFDSIQKKESDKPRSKDPRLPAGDWNRYGGMLQFVGAKDLFPNGLGVFQRQLGLPLIVHSRWIDPKSPYHASYKISGIAAVDPQWWDKIISDIASWGVVTYEQDWNNWIYLKSPQLSNTTWAGDAYLDNMARACAERHLTMQYCMVLPRILLQGGAKYPNLTTVRVSDDRFGRSRWREFFYGSTFASALGVWPWTDVYRSSETPNILISTLSGGMVGLSDRIGDEDADNIFRAVRKDGVIVKPDAPLTPMDDTFIAEGTADAAGSGAPAVALVSATHSGSGADATWYVFACTREAKKPPQTPWSLKPASLGLAGSAVAYDYFAGTAQPVDQLHPLAGQLNAAHDWTYQIIAPVGPSGMAFIGDTGKFATCGRQRIAALSQDAQSLHADVTFAAGETAATLTLYAPAAPSIQATGGSAGPINYDAATKLAKVEIHPDSPAAAGSEVTVGVLVHLH